MSSSFDAKIIRLGDGEDDCWLWTAAVLHGYGVAWHEGKAQRAHRVAWMREYGPIPDDRMIMHICNNKSCIRPSHLALGTHLENMADARVKGTMLRKISLADKRHIVELRKSGMTFVRIAARYGVNPQSVRYHVRRAA